MLAVVHDSDTEAAKQAALDACHAHGYQTINRYTVGVIVEAALAAIERRPPEPPDIIETSCTETS